MRLWERDKRLGDEGNVPNSLHCSAVAAVSAEIRSIWKLTALSLKVQHTIGSTPAQERPFTGISTALAMRKSFVRLAIIEKVQGIDSQAITNEWRFICGQRVFILDDYDRAIWQLYESGSMCSLCRFSLFYLDEYHPSERGGENQWTNQQ